MQLAIDFSAPVCPESPSEADSEREGRAVRTSIKDGGRELPPEVYTRDEVQRLLDGPLGRNEKTRTRNRALLVVVMWRAGLRVSEALGLNMGDLRPVADPISETFRWCIQAAATAAA